MNQTMVDESGEIGGGFVVVEEDEFVVIVLGGGGMVVGQGKINFLKS